MLQFWKKPKVENQGASVGQLQTTTHLNGAKDKNPHPVHCFDDRAFNLEDFEATKRKSVFCKNLLEVLEDKAALEYFSKYMESRNGSKYLMCWSEIELFKNVLSQHKEAKVDHDSLSVSTDCDSYTADTNSLCDLTISEKVTPTSFELSSLSEQDISDTSPKKTMTEELTDDRKSLIENAVMIFKKFIAQEAAHNVKCSDIIRNEIIENICDIDKVLLGNCFNKVQTFVFEVMEKEYFEAFLGSDFFCKYQIDVFTSGQVALDDILHNETVLFYFMEFLQQENKCSLLEFWIAATNLQQQLQNQKEFFDPHEAQSDAVVLYDKYFSLQAYCPLGFPDKVRFEIEQNICGEDGLVIDCFKVPIKMVEQVLEKAYLEPFLASQLFYKYLSELINTVQNDYIVNNQNTKPLSDCSSEKSFSTNSTFLALEINGNDAKKCKNKCTDMSIDVKQLCDPDSLWRRKKSHRLSCGRITAMGKFETDLEPEPDRKGFVLKNVVKKIVNLDEDKKKEEMAWQVAEMIVKDITNVTLSQDKVKHS